MCVDQQKEIKSRAPEDFEDSTHWPDPQTSHEVMMKVLEHFQKHHLVVGKKLGHARTATAQSLQDMKVVYKELRLDQNSREFREISRFDILWDEIICDFATSGVTEEELDQIEHILTMIPDVIRRYYEALVVQDKILQSLIEELNSPEYQRAIALTKKIQERRCRLSGLTPQAFDTEGGEGHVDESGDGPVIHDVTVYQNVFRRDRLN